jgi:site-specific DNA-methyltransferase (cytosine-N4-specific)
VRFTDLYKEVILAGKIGDYLKTSGKYIEDVSEPLVEKDNTSIMLNSYYDENLQKWVPIYEFENDGHLTQYQTFNEAFIHFINHHKGVILNGNSMELLKQLPPNFIDTCVTSPPYWGLRDYGVKEQIGAERTPDEYVEKLVDVFREVKRVLKDDGTLWLNIGDSFASVHTGGHKSAKSSVGANREGVQEIRQPKAPPHEYGLKDKDLVLIPFRLAKALQEDGWYLRMDIIWHKPNAMPESVRDRPTLSHEYIFLLSKNKKYYYDNEAIKEETSDKKGLRNKRSVWSVPTRPLKEAHFATYPVELVLPCILAGSRTNGIVLDPFFGAGTTGLAAIQHNRSFIGIEINPQYIEIANKRLEAVLSDD